MEEERKEIRGLLTQGLVLEAFCAAVKGSASGKAGQSSHSQHDGADVISDLADINKGLDDAVRQKNEVVLEMLQQALKDHTGAHESSAAGTEGRPTTATANLAQQAANSDGQPILSHWMEFLCTLDEENLSFQEACKALANSKLSPSVKAHLQRAIEIATGVTGTGDAKQDLSQQEELTELVSLAAGKKLGNQQTWLPSHLLKQNPKNDSAQLWKGDKRSDRFEKFLETLQSTEDFRAFRNACFLFINSQALLQYLENLEAAQISGNLKSASRANAATNSLFDQSLDIDEAVKPKWLVEIAWAATQKLLSQHEQTKCQALLLTRLKLHALPIPLKPLQQAIEALEFLLQEKDEMGSLQIDEWMSGKFFQDKGDGDKDSTIVDRTGAKILDHICSLQQWDIAYRWGNLTGLSTEEVTKQQADQIWVNLRSLGVANDYILQEIVSLFKRQKQPPLCIVAYLLQVAAEAGTSSDEQPVLRQDVFKVCQEVMLACQAEDRPPKQLLHELRKANALGGGPLTEAVYSRGWVPYTLTQLGDDNLRTSSLSLAKTDPPPTGSSTSNASWMPLVALTASGGRSAPLSREETQAAQKWAAVDECLQSIIDQSSQPQVQQAVRSLLDIADTGAARSLSKRLKVPPIELALTESALRIFTTMDPASSSGKQTFAQSVPVAVLSLLRHRGYKINTTEDLLSCLSKSCKTGAGGSTCSWVESHWFAASLLGISPNEVLELGAIAILEALLLKKANEQELQRFVRVTKLPSPVVAQLLASLFFKGLLLDQSWKDGSTGKAWSTDSLIHLVQALSEPVDVANALLELLLDRHPAITAELEVEFVLAAHRLYSDATCLEGIDSLLEFTTLSVNRWIKQKEHKALVKLTTGLSRYKPVRQALKSLVEGDAMEAILQKSPSVGMESLGKAGVSVGRLAVLASIQQHGSREHMRMASMHFNLQRQYAEQLLLQAKETKEPVKDRLQQSMNIIEQQKLWLEAGQAFKRADCPKQARECALNAAQLEESSHADLH